MKCSFCGLAPVASPPDDWRVYGEMVRCPECLIRHFRRKRLTMTVTGLVGAEWPQFNTVLAEALGQRSLLPIPGGCCRFTIAEGQPLACVSIGHRWWTLRLRTAGWSRGRRAVYARMVSGEAVLGDSRLFLRTTPQECAGETCKILCKTTVWLPSDLLETSLSITRAPSRRAPPGLEQNIEEVDLEGLRAALRENRISFPSQVPTFRACGHPELQSKLVQLFFVLGWSCAAIAERYGLSPQQVQLLLASWRLRAIRAGYLQRITGGELGLIGRRTSTTRRSAPAGVLRSE